MDLCPRCPHPNHMFSTCLEYPDCQCYDRPGIPGGVCDNTLITFLEKKRLKMDPESEYLQHKLISFLDTYLDTYPEELIDKLCQTVFDYYNEERED